MQADGSLLGNAVPACQLAACGADTSGSNGREAVRTHTMPTAHPFFPALLSNHLPFRPPFVATLALLQDPLSFAIVFGLVSGMMVSWLAGWSAARAEAAAAAVATVAPPPAAAKLQLGQRRCSRGSGRGKRGSGRAPLISEGMACNACDMQPVLHAIRRCTWQSRSCCPPPSGLTPKTSWSPPVSKGVQRRCNVVLAVQRSSCGQAAAAGVLCEGACRAAPCNR